MNPKVSVIVPVYNVLEYIPSFIDSLVKQNYTDFEVVFVNDGSTDGGEKIIEKSEDERFVLINQVNKGVSSARNNGMKCANGKYIMFADPDDVLPFDAIGSLVNKMEKSQADLVVGIMDAYELGTLKKTSVKLAIKDKIGHFNRGLLWSFTVCNKIFKKSIIEKNSIIFEDVAYCEDGIFLFNYLRYADKIVGCNKSVYSYIKRDFSKEKSASQNLAYKYVTSNEIVLDKIELYTFEFAKKYLLEAQEKWGKSSGHFNERYVAILNFNSELYRRMIQYNIIYRFYRNIWLLDDLSIEVLLKMQGKWKKKMFPSDWSKIIKNNDDIFNNGELVNKEYLKEHPYFTFVVRDIDEEMLTRWLDNIYFQKFPAFEIILCCDVPKKYENVENIRICNGDLNDIKINGKYIFDIKSNIYFMQDTLTNLYKELENRKSDAKIISLSVKNIKEGNLKSLVLFENEMKYFEEVDRCIFINKIYKNSVATDSIESLKTEELFIISDVNDKDLLAQVKGRRAKREYKKLIKRKLDKHTF